LLQVDCGIRIFNPASVVSGSTHEDQAPQILENKLKNNEVQMQASELGWNRDATNSNRPYARLIQLSIGIFFVFLTASKFKSSIIVMIDDSKVKLRKVC
jgi:hypothetical protein